MPAHNEEFPWESYYGNYNFFEARMQQLGSVRNLTNLDVGLYEIERNGYENIKVFICECYSFGVAEYIEVKNNYGDIDAVIINSNWCNYTTEAKHFCYDEQVGLFEIGEFMGALTKENIWEYLTKEQREYFEEQGWL